MANVDSITKVGDAIKYKYSDASVTYRLPAVRVLVVGDNIDIQNQYLHPRDSQAKIEVKYGQVSEKYGTNTPEEYVEYLILNDLLFSGEASEVVSLPEAKKVQVVGDLSYFAFAEPGSSEADPVWKATRLDTSVVGNRELKQTWADNGNYTQVATDLTLLTYS